MHPNMQPNANERCCWPQKRISWTAILAGVVSALVLEALLNLLGAGIGLVSFAPDKDVVAGLGVGSVIWLIIVSIISLFIGGWVAAFASGRIKRKSGMLQGFLTWGVATLLTLFFMASTTGALISGASGLIGHGLSGAGRIGLDQSDYLTDNTALSSINSRLKPGVDKEEMLKDLKDPVMDYATAKNDDEKNQSKQKISEIVSKNTDLSSQEIDQKITDVEKSYNDMKKKAGEAADKTASVIGSIAIATFFSFLLSAIAAIVGGVVGVKTNRRHCDTSRHDIIS